MRVWDAEVVPLLKIDVELNAVTLLEELQRRHPGQYDEGVLCTPQRRMRQWRATHGAEREIFRLGWLSFTLHCRPLACCPR